MNDDIIRPAPPGLQLPAQSAPVHRAGAAGGSVAGGGVEADVDWRRVFDAAGSAASATLLRPFGF